MKPFLNANRTRQIATAMLLVWLMALAVGVANACLPIESSDRHGLAMQSAHVATKTPDRHSSPAADDACLKFCVAGPVTLVKVKPAGGESLGVDSTAALISSGSSLWAVELGPRVLSQGVSRWLEPPVSIRFSRLTI